MRERRGELIRLDSDCAPGEWWIRGHVTDEEAIAEVVAHLAEERDEDDEIPALRVLRREWARWRPPTAAEQDCDHPIGWMAYGTQREPSRGAFAVTLVIDTDEHERRQDERRSYTEAREALRARVVGLYPESTIESLTPWSVRLRLPGLTYPIEMLAEDPAHVRVCQCDLEQYQREYQGRGR